MTASRITNAILVSCLLCAGAPATASTYIESLDAGDLIGTALAVGPGVSSIQGQVASSRTTDVVDIDVYRLELPAGAFSAAVTASTRRHWPSSSGSRANWPGLPAKFWLSSQLRVVAGCAASQFL